MAPRFVIIIFFSFFFFLYTKARLVCKHTCILVAAAAGESQ